MDVHVDHVPLAVRAPRAVVAASGVDVDDRVVVRHGRRLVVDDRDRVRGERGPARADVGDGVEGLRGRQRVAAEAPGDGVAVRVDEHGRAGLEHRGPGRDAAVAPAVVGDVGVGAQDHRGQPVDVARDRRRRPVAQAEDRGPAGGAVGVRAQVAGELGAVARRVVARAAVEARGGAGVPSAGVRDGPDVGDVGADAVHERVGARGGHRLEGDLGRRAHLAGDDHPAEGGHEHPEDDDHGDHAAGQPPRRRRRSLRDDGLRRHQHRDHSPPSGRAPTGLRRSRGSRRADTVR